MLMGLGLGGTIAAAARAKAATHADPATELPPSQGVTIDRGYGPIGDFEVVARFTGPGPSGIVVLPDQRMFVGFPRHANDHDGATLGELKDGRIVPYPDAAWSLPSDRAPAQRLISVHGMTMDRRGRLWLIDDGKRAGHPIPEGAAKVVGIDPATNAIFKTVVLKAPVLLPDSHMNDLRIDLTHGAEGTAFVTDSSFGTSPALVVVDLATGRQRRVLADHPSTHAEPGFMAVVEGRPLVYDPKHPTFIVGGADGITLSPDSRTVYYSALTSRRLYSLPTETLANFALDDGVLAKAVRDEGEKGVADGLATDDQGRLYTTNFEHDAIFRRELDGTFTTIVRDPRILSPDGIFVDGRYVYCTLGQWNRLATFNGGKDMRVEPYDLIRVPLTDAATATAYGPASK
ncbi:gluconolactonase [Ameyamaea chiangmaiensis NBRC 103196]|nr:gluconolactonase [Ameyamaea chiangmaiensis NBRC 103196]